MGVKEAYNKDSVKKHDTITEYDHRQRKAVVIARKPEFRCPNCKDMSYYEAYCTQCGIDMTYKAEKVMDAVPEKNIRAKWKILVDEDGNKVKWKKAKPKVKEDKPKKE